MPLKDCPPGDRQVIDSLMRSYRTTWRATSFSRLCCGPYQRRFGFHLDIFSIIWENFPK
jgi:hypothetical protein